MSLDSKILIGSIPRRELSRLLGRHFGRERRIQMAAKRVIQAPDTSVAAPPQGESSGAPNMERRPSRLKF